MAAMYKYGVSRSSNHFTSEHGKPCKYILQRRFFVFGVVVGVASITLFFLVFLEQQRESNQCKYLFLVCINVTKLHFLVV